MYMIRVTVVTTVSQEAPIICHGDHMDRVVRNRQRHYFTNECHIVVRKHHQSGVDGDRISTRSTSDHIGSGHY
jgi:hypothetical protein